MSRPRAATSADDAAAHFARDGLFWMRDVLSQSDLAALKTTAAEHFHEVVRALLLQQVICAETPACKYAEVMARDGARFDCRQGANSPPLATLLRPGGAAGKLIAVLQRVLSPEAQVVALGQIVAMAHDGWADLMGDRLDEEGNTDDAEFGVQRWHADGPAESFAGGAGDALTLFIPLVDLTADNGPTEFLLGSHREPAGPPRRRSPRAATRAAARPSTTILAPAGSVIAFDFKLLHRGLINQMASEDRPMLYAVVGRPIWTADGRCMLPRLDGGGTSLFTGDAVPPIHARFRLGESVAESAAREAVEAEQEEGGGRRKRRRNT